MELRGAGIKEGFKWQRLSWKRYQGCTVQRISISAHSRQAIVLLYTIKTHKSIKKTSHTTRQGFWWQLGTPSKQHKNINFQESTNQLTQTQGKTLDWWTMGVWMFWITAMNQIDWRKSCLGNNLITQGWMILRSILWDMTGKEA